MKRITCAGVLGLSLVGPLLAALPLLIGGCPNLGTDPNSVMDPIAAREATFKTSQHFTRTGKEYFYKKETGGMELLTDIPLSQLACQKCHGLTLADGTAVTDASYAPSCRDCHAQADYSDTPADSVCLGCHSRQGLEAKNYTDVHRGADFDCYACHTDKEMHGDGTMYESMLDRTENDARCERCHIKITNNAAHVIHQEGVDCSACHMQSVVSCFNCHYESEIQGGGKRYPGPLKDFVMLVNRPNDKQVHAATLMGLTFGDKTFVVVAPYYAHTITNKARDCDDCHANANIVTLNTTGKLAITTYNAATNKLVAPTGIIPVPQNWKEAFTFDWMIYTGDPASKTTDPTKWQYLKNGVDLFQMLYAEPLTPAQMQVLSKPQPE